MHPLGPGRSIRKIDNVLTSGEDGVLFFRKSGKLGWRFPRTRRDKGFGVKDGEWLGNGAASH